MSCIFNNCCGGCYRHGSDEGEKFKRDERDVLLNVSTGSAGPLPTITTPLTEPIPVVSTSVDTDRIGCRTNNLLTFTAIINLPLAAVASLSFQVLRAIDDGPAIPVGSSYTFAATAAAAGSFSFAFQFADLDVEPGFYTYSVVIATNSTIAVTAGATITSATLSVLAVKD